MANMTNYYVSISNTSLTTLIGTSSNKKLIMALEITVSGACNVSLKYSNDNGSTFYHTSSFSFSGANTLILDHKCFLNTTQSLYIQSDTAINLTALATVAEGEDL